MEVRALSLARLVVVAWAIGLLAGCIPSSVAPPTAPGPLRYRDEMFLSATVTPNLVYGSAPDLSGQPVTLRLDLYRPTGDTVTSRPAVVFVHGGGFSSGDKGDLAGIVTPLVRRGFVAVSINYRLLAPAGCSTMPTADACTAAAQAAINDAQAAVRWLRANATTYGVDPTRLAIEGFSAGGITATGVGSLWENVGSSGNPGYSSRVSAWVSIAGGLPGGEGVGPGDGAGFLLSGTADAVVPHQWSVETAQALVAAGEFAVLRAIPGGGHSLPDQTMLATETASFYYLTLDLASAPQ